MGYLLRDGGRWRERGGKRGVGHEDIEGVEKGMGREHSGSRKVRVRERGGGKQPLL